MTESGFLSILTDDDGGVWGEYAPERFAVLHRPDPWPFPEEVELVAGNVLWSHLGFMARWDVRTGEATRRGRDWT